MSSRVRYPVATWGWCECCQQTGDLADGLCVRCWDRAADMADSTPGATIQIEQRVCDFDHGGDEQDAYGRPCYVCGRDTCSTHGGSVNWPDDLFIMVTQPICMTCAKAVWPRIEALIEAAKAHHG